MKPRIHFGDDTIDGEQFFAATLRSAAALTAAGIGPGDHFALLLRNEPLVLELMMAARWIGARWVPVNWHFKADETHGILADSGARLLIGHAELIERVRSGIPEGMRVFSATPHAHTRSTCGVPATEATDPAWETWRDSTERTAPVQAAPGGGVFFTSGTTGRPKGVRFLPPTPEQVAALMEGGRIGYGLAPGARVFVSAPLYHSGPCHYAVTAALLGCDIVLEPRFGAETTLRCIDAHRISHLYLVPTMFVRLLQLSPAVTAGYDLSAVRFVASTGAPCPPSVKRQMIEWWGPVFHEVYAASELGIVTHIDSAEALRKPGSAGRPLPGYAIRIVGDDGRPCAPGEVGTVHVACSRMPDFVYLNAPEARAAAEHDGAITLGDLGMLDTEGFLFLVDRRADVVNSGGTKVHTQEIEATLIQMPGVADVAVYGVPDDEFGQALVAAVQPLPGATPSAAQVQDFVRQRLAGFKVPRHVEFHAALPREDTGKLFKRRLRDASIGRRA